MSERPRWQSIAAIAVTGILVASSWLYGGSTAGCARTGATAEMARECPDTLDALGGISGVGAKKLEAYGAAILGVLAN